MKNDVFPRSVCIICEGYEEFDYISRLKLLNVFNSKYRIKPKNAKGFDHIYQVYTSEFQNANSELVLIFCDTEMYPYEKYERLLKKINAFHNRRAVAKQIVFFANPCTMQIMLMHFFKVRLKTNSKTENAKLIRDATGVNDYQADKQQRADFMNHISVDNYELMKSYIKDIADDYTIVPSTNILGLLEKLERDDTSWVDDLIKKVEK